MPLLKAAVFDLGPFSFAGDLWAAYLWRVRLAPLARLFPLTHRGLIPRRLPVRVQCAYLNEAVSLRQRCMFLINWIQRSLFGRDLSKVRPSYCSPRSVAGHSRSPSTSSAVLSA